MQSVPDHRLNIYIFNNGKLSSDVSGASHNGGDTSARAFGLTACPGMGMLVGIIIARDLRL